MIIHKKVQHCKKYVQGRGFVLGHQKKYVYGKGLIDSLIPTAINFAKNPESALNVGKAVKELATASLNTGKTIKDLKSMVNAKKAASEIKNNNILGLLEDIKGISIGKGFRVI
jgi:hypothetical protein